MCCLCFVLMRMVVVWCLRIFSGGCRTAHTRGRFDRFSCCVMLVVAVKENCLLYQLTVDLIVIRNDLCCFVSARRPHCAGRFVVDCNLAIMLTFHFSEIKCVSAAALLLLMCAREYRRKYNCCRSNLRTALIMLQEYLPLAQLSGETVAVCLSDTRASLATRNQHTRHHHHHYHRRHHHYIPLALLGLLGRARHLLLNALNNLTPLGTQL